MKWSGQQPDHRCDFPVCLTLHSRGRSPLSLTHASAAALMHARIPNHRWARCSLKKPSSMPSRLLESIGWKSMHAFPVTRAKHLPEHLEGSGARSRSNALDLYRRSLLTISISHQPFSTFFRTFLAAHAPTYLLRSCPSTKFHIHSLGTMQIQMIRATYASQDNLERFLAGIFGEGRAEVSVSAPLHDVR